MSEKLQTPLISDGIVHAIKFSIATLDEICKYSINECPISHPSQLTNPFLGLPLESGRCESCGTTENGNCEGHFGYIELPVPVYHPSYITELKDVLSLVCFKCMRIKKGKVGKSNVSTTSCSYCRDLPPISIKEVKTSDGASSLQLSVPSRTRWRDGFWNFLGRFGFHYGDGTCRTLLPLEALNILKEIPEETKKRLSAKGYFPQSGYILEYLPVPPNCLLVPEISDGKSVMSSDVSISLLKRVLNKIEHIKRSRSGSPNFESHEVECNELQLAIAEYMHLRGTTKTPHDITRKFVLGPEAIKNSSKQWLEKMRTLFISKGSGFSSRSVITGDAYIGINTIGLPSEIAKKVTFEERVTTYNLGRLQKMVDDRLCVTYRDGNSTYAIAVGSKGHTTLKVGQVINRCIVNGDIVFINRPPSTHKHSLQAFTVYVHDDHTIKINPLVCAPLGADFDGDCIHIFYPQSLAAKAEVMELFSVEQQLLSSHSGQLNFQVVNDSLLSLKVMANTSFLKKEMAQQFAMFVSPDLPPPAVFRAHGSGPLWTIHQILQCALPPSVDCIGQRHVINQSEIIKFDFNRELLQASLTDIITSILVAKGPRDALDFFNSLQPLLMEVLSLEGYSISLKDFDVPNSILREVRASVQDISNFLPQLRISYNELLQLQVEKDLSRLKRPIVAFLLQLSSLGFLIDSKSESSIGKVIQQLGFLGLQLFDRGKLYSRDFVEDIYCHFVSKCSIKDKNPSSEAYGLVKSSFFHGLNPFEAFVHSISSREVIIRSSRGLTEPGVLFKNLMAILRDVVISYDGTVRNVCSNSLIQFEYELDEGAMMACVAPAGEPVGVLAATAISNPAYKAVLDSSQSTNSSWELMKEILLCKSGYKNDVIDRRVILYLNECCCGKKFCKENAALAVRNCLKTVTLKYCAVDFSIEYQKQITLPSSSGNSAGLVGHIHLDMMRLETLNQDTDEILRKCQEKLLRYARKKGHLSNIFRRTFLSASECCGFPNSDDGSATKFPCLQFSYCAGAVDETLEQGIHIMNNTICPELLEIIVKGDPRVDAVNIIWSGPDATSWVRNPHRNVRGELALEVVVQKGEAKKNGDAWGVVLDACLPVMHLIDTTRSIPYGIQQIKELLGISCTFDQAVQRLSKSIRMVSKGVIKEHLVLVGNNMTCTGNLIGFNTSGFKALFRSLKIQAPFTEATLFTPMKCFERAAEKCHTDSLGSIVSSVSWGKHVAVGTGTHFELMWGQKHQVSCNEDVGKDVYDLLAWVREPRERDLTGPCVGSDIDDFFDEYDDMPLSPEPNSVYEKPTFEDSVEAVCNESDVWQGWGSKEPSAHNSKKSSWENATATVVESDNWGAWGSKDKSSADNGNKSSWEKILPTTGGWDNREASGKKDKLPTDNVNQSSWDKVSPKAVASEDWKASSSRDETAPDSFEMATKNSGAWSAWDANNVVRPDRSTKLTEESDGFNNFANDDVHPTWAANKPTIESSSGWDADWGKKLQGAKEPDARLKKSTENDSSWTARKPLVENSADWSRSACEKEAWPPKSPNAGWNEKQGNGSSWTARKPEAESSSGWQKNNENKAWTVKNPNSGWKESRGNEPSWTARKPEAENSAGWQESAGNKAWSAKIPDPGSKGIAENESSWTAKRPEVENSPAGRSENVENNTWSAENLESGGKQNDAQHASLALAAKKPEVDCLPGFNESGGQPWVTIVSEDKSSAGWNENGGNSWGAKTPEVGGSSGTAEWGGKKGKQGWKSQGWGSSSFNDRRGQKNNNSPRPQSRPEDRGGWRRAEVFTSEEEKIIVDVEPVINSIRKILRETSDGDRLSPEDQKFVLENVFEYHPDRQAKVTGQIDYIMVDKHGSFKETRCLYVVSEDGSRSDFSYLKCMENFVKGRYPDHAESFCRKFFRRRNKNNNGQPTNTDSQPAEEQS